MAVRRRLLPGGWYPDDEGELRELVAAWTSGALAAKRGAIAAIAPHAGWTFSGRLAAAAVSSLKSPGDAVGLPATIAVVGGHLPPGAPPLAARESEYRTPLGLVPADLELLDALESALASRRSPGRAPLLQPDEAVDNTVEVLLPLVAAIHPGARALWLRAPADATAIALGESLAAAAASLGRALLCLGSTDLTHYGPNYGFSPKGRGRAAEDWVRDSNDRRFIDALLALDATEALARGGSELSACSPGAAATALSFALASGASRSELLGYSTSLETRHDDSFVGYAALGFYA